MVQQAYELDPVKITGRTFLDLPKSTQDMWLAAYADKGMKGKQQRPEDVMAAIQRGLPKATGRAGSRVM